MQGKSATYFVIYREENYWTYADSHKLKRWLFLPPAISLTLHKGPAIWKCFPHIIHSMLFYKHTHKIARTKLQSSWYHKYEIFLCICTLFSMDKIHLLTFFAKHPQLSWADCRCLTGQVCCLMSFQSKAKAYTPTFRCALLTKCAVQHRHRSRINPANGSICSLTSAPRETGKVPHRHKYSASRLLCRGHGEKSKTQSTVPSRCQNLQADSCRLSALPVAGQRLLRCVGSLSR